MLLLVNNNYIYLINIASLLEIFMVDLTLGLTEGLTEGLFKFFIFFPPVEDNRIRFFTDSKNANKCV